ncbi:cytochrome b [Methylorubrum salsuginis]|uniref:Cytochrome b561 n=1 Tax=Methylorubrum salsuginis TaxID=414703 RepID=A0A1I4JHL9_9HYPH|nr:cytochrome b/b6 domain-containing protein [Methylorubrum salsuginis]SFL65616.1 cytochrome b561 [Methylorubrum salsuginis]
MTRPTETLHRTGRYDAPTIALHWLTAGLVLGLWLIGTFLEDLVPKGGLRSGVWSAHVDLGFALAALVLALLVWRRGRGRDLPVADRGPLHRLAKATHAALYVLLAVIVGLGIANAFVRGASLGPVGLPQLGDPAWRQPLTRWHGLAANLLLLLALFHAVAALVHHYLWHDAVLRRMLPRRT